MVVGGAAVGKASLMQAASEIFEGKSVSVKNSQNPSNILFF